MNGRLPFEGTLFSGDFLSETVTRDPDWRSLDAAALDDLEADLLSVFRAFPTGGTPNESQTEDDLIWPVLERLGWTASLRQQNLSAAGRQDVPDGLLFADGAAKARANALSEEWRRYGLGLAAVESKRWGRPLDRRSGQAGEDMAPSTQMLRYLRRIDDMTNGGLRWGILTNGAKWRLYWQGARSVSDRFFEVDLPALLDLPGRDEGLFALDRAQRRHGLKAFALVFRREAFLPDPGGRTFHRRALDEGRFYEERVAASLSDVVFERVFPGLIRAIADAAPEASLAEARDAALILLYRLLFLFYAEDRDLLPTRDRRYGAYALRSGVRDDIRRRMDEGAVFSDMAACYWSVVGDLCRAIDSGDAALGLPPYDGGLFDRKRAPLLETIRLGDRAVAEAVDALCFERTAEGRRYINYRDLGVQQMGSIYERLLEYEPVRDGGAIAIRPNVFARKGSGSYYTPDDLVGLILEETVGPLADARMDAFAAQASAFDASPLPAEHRIARLEALDPAERLLDLKICDPAMGSGHFLVALVDYLADRTISVMAEAASAAEGYVSPLARRIEDIRSTILDNAEKRGWVVDPARLDDRHIVRRMVLKRCVYGVDKNPMAVELAKVALWLHTFTVGAPLSFLDHHLRCGDSLFGAWARTGMDRAAEYDAPLLLHAPMREAVSAAAGMRAVEALTDVEIAEAHRSAKGFAEVEAKTAPLDRFLSLVHALDWLAIRDNGDKAALRAFFDGQFGDPVAVAMGRAEPGNGRPEAVRFAELLAQARALIAGERFFNWQAAFPGVWTDWESAERKGGFDAAIGNPPWERMKLEPVEWFARRRPEIALAPRAADRKRAIAALERDGDPLAEEFAAANERAAMAFRMARNGGDYPLLSGGDINLYSLFVERAMALVKPGGAIGLLTPSGVASDKTAARFFKGVSTEGRLKTLYDFENRRTRHDAPPFFPDVDSRFKFCVFVAGPSPFDAPARCAFFLQSVSELDDPERRFVLTAEDFARVNPNTGTAPVFRTRRDAELTTAIHGRLPVLVNRSSGKAVKAWPVKYATMFHMANDSALFHARKELERREDVWPIDGNRFDSPEGRWVPLYEGKMVQAFDHRAANIVVNEENLFRTGRPETVEASMKRNPEYYPRSRYCVLHDSRRWKWSDRWAIAFKDITAATNMRTVIAAIVPEVGAGNTLPLLPLEDGATDRAALACLIVANLNAAAFDFVARQKVPTTHLNWYIVEQLPVVPLERYETVRFGPKTAGEIVRETVLELTYTARDMAPFARDMGHVDEAGEALPPFVWDEGRRLRLRARLDAVFFHLYGVAGRDDLLHVWSAFPIVEREETAAWGRYLSRDLCLAWTAALSAGRPDAEIAL